MSGIWDGNLLLPGNVCMCSKTVKINRILKALPSSHSKVRDGVVVGLQDLGVIEDLVPECVEPVQGHSDVRGRHPVLQETQRG